MKILVCNGAYIGDLILATSVLPAIKACYPHAEIGFVTSTWAQVVVKDHLLVDHLYLFDHPLNNRQPITRKEKQRMGGKTWYRAFNEIKAEGYDLGIELCSAYHQNMCALLYYTDIPHRVGYWSNRNPYYLNRLSDWKDESLHIVERHGQLLLDCSIVELKHLDFLKPNLNYSVMIETRKVPGPYIVVHMGTGDRHREWRDDYWKWVCQKLTDEGHKLVFIGNGKREIDRIQTVIEGLDPTLVVDLSNQLSWKELIPLIKQAKLLIGLESMAGHLAAAVGTHSIVLYGGFHFIDLWKPYTSNCTIVSPSKEFFDSRGFTPRGTIKEITPQSVCEKVFERLRIC